MRVTCNAVEMQNVWDEGMGPFFVYCESLGPVGVVRALSWEEAYECVIDEIMHDADPEYVAEFGDEDTGDLPEGVHFRGNGVPSNPNRHTYLAQEDLNGNQLIPLETFHRDYDNYKIEIYLECDTCPMMHNISNELPIGCQ